MNENMIENSIISIEMDARKTTFCNLKKLDTFAIVLPFT